MQLLHLAGHLYVLTKEYYREVKNIHSLKKDLEHYTHKYHSATNPGDKQKYHHKAQKYAHKYQKAMEEKQKLVSKMHSFNAGYARALQEEARMQHK
jgi:uncharacterized protein (DUF3084 family)